MYVLTIYVKDSLPLLLLLVLPETSHYYKICYWWLYKGQSSWSLMWSYGRMMSEPQLKWTIPRLCTCTSDIFPLVAALIPRKFDSGVSELGCSMFGVICAWFTRTGEYWWVNLHSNYFVAFQQSTGFFWLFRDSI